MAKDIIKIKPCNKIVTFDPKTKKPNGWLLEIVSDANRFTKHLSGQIYLTVANPGEFKGYHLHAGADYFVTCIKGRILDIIYKNKDAKQEVEMGDGDFKTIFIPKKCPHGIKNIGAEPAYILIYRYPAWNQNIREQLDIAPEEIETNKAWSKIREFIKNFNEK